MFEMFIIVEGRHGRGGGSGLEDRRGGCTTARSKMLRAEETGHNSPSAQTSAPSPPTHFTVRQVHPTPVIQTPAPAAPPMPLLVLFLE